MEKVKYVARLRFPEYIFGNGHPYSTPLNEDDYKNLNPDIMRDFHKRFYATSPFYMLISGSIPKDIQKTLNRYFGQHKVEHDQPKLKIRVPMTTPDKFQLIEKGNSLQSALRIGKALFNKKDPDFIKMKVVNTILGGYFGSRLMSNIREDKGYTYGIGSALTSMKHSGIFTISSEVGVDVREKAVDEIFHEIRKLATDLVPDEELNLVKNYMLGNFLRSADGPFALSEMVKSVVDYDFSMDYYNRYIQTIKNITAKEIRELAVKYLDPHTLVTLVVGK
jgi:predicted Zn-dependent peptidase